MTSGMIVPKLIEVDGEPFQRLLHQRSERYKVLVDRRKVYLIRSQFVPFVQLCIGWLLREPVHGESMIAEEEARVSMLSKLRFQICDQTEYIYRWWPVVESLWESKRVKGYWQLVLPETTKISIDDRLYQFDDERVKEAMQRLKVGKVMA